MYVRFLYIQFTVQTPNFHYLRQVVCLQRLYQDARPTEHKILVVKRVLFFPAIWVDSLLTVDTVDPSLLAEHEFWRIVGEYV
jgi:hypothetical protein